VGVVNLLRNYETGRKKQSGEKLFEVSLQQER
jgi:hypothetical protein